MQGVRRPVSFRFYFWAALISLLVLSATFAGCGNYSGSQEGMTGATAQVMPPETSSSIASPDTGSTAVADGGVTTATHTAAGVGTVVSDVKNAAELDAGAMVVTHQLGVNFEVPGTLYGTKAKKPVQLGPQGAKKAMTQDALGGEDLPVAVPSIDGRQLLYYFWQVLTSDDPSRGPGDPVMADGTRMATPSLRLRDVVSGEDRLVVSGARSAAWRADGTLAYAKGVDPDYRYNMPYLSRVVVQRGLDGSPETWTSDADRYTVLQWAKDSLFVMRETVDGGGELLALSGPDDIRTILPSGEALIGLSPDGERILVSSGGFGSGDPPTIREIEWATGREIAQLSLAGVLDPLSGEPILGCAGASWVGDKAVVAVAPADLVVLSTEGDTLTVEEVLTFDSPGLARGSVVVPLLDETGSKVSFVTREVNASGDLVRCAVVTYDFGSRECRRWISPGGPAIAGLVYDSSRPR